MTELIKTRKQYEETLDFLKINRFAYDEANEIDDLIEALREVATAAKPAVLRLQLLQKAGPIGKPPKWTQDLADAVDALPDWIKEDG